jgi:hypothetical protein
VPGEKEAFSPLQFPENNLHGILVNCYQQVGKVLFPLQKGSNLDFHTNFGLKHEKPMENTCRNCQTSFIGNFCPHCGQNKKGIDRPLKFLIVDFAGTFFAFDTRAWRTIKSVLFFPGKMEAEYIDGKQIKYMPPFRFYIFVSFLFFLIISWVTKSQINHDPSWRENVVLVDQRSNSQLAETNIIPEKSQEVISLNTDSLENHKAEKAAVVYIEAEKFPLIYLQRVMDNPEAYFSKFFRYLSWSLFILMPFFGSLLWMLFKRSRPFYIAHFVFSLNQHVFVYITILLALLINAFVASSLANLIFLLIPLYIFIGAMRLYRQKWYKTLLRLIVATGIYAFTLFTITLTVLLITIFY